MRRVLNALAICLLMPIGIAPANAAVSVQPVPVDGGPPILVIKGDFEHGDDTAGFAAAASKSGAKIVVFDSGGGNIVSAMRFGRMIRSLGLETVQLRSMECSSACALAFMGGAVRSAEPGSIGVHRASFSGDTAMDGHTAVAAVQAMTAEIMTYMMEMGVDPKLLQLSLSIDSADMRYLTAGEMAQFGITTSTEVNAAPAQVDTSLATAPATPAPAGEKTGEAGRSRALSFSRDYHSAWSKPNPVALAYMERVYGDAVTFYGKNVAHADVMREKRNFADRWPLRAYSVKHGTERVICSDTCKITGVVEWYAHSPKRARTSSGAAEFGMVWNPRTNLIESETGKVLQTDKGAREPSRIIDQWRKQNGDCRGGSGDSDETLRACDRREEIGAKLEAVGWCYGRPGEYGYQMDWHVCGR